MRRTVLAVALWSAAIITSGCLSLVVVNPNLPAADAVTQASLQSFMLSAVTPTIVLRVPAPQRQLTQAQAQQGDVELSRTYNLIEKELVKAGFTVRDRGLLEEVLRSTQNLDYRVIQDKIGAQLILEIGSISTHSYDSTQYSRVKDRAAGTLPWGAFPIKGWQFECKVILVSSGEIGGLYTIDVAPANNHFLVSGAKFQNATQQGRPDPAHIGYGAPLEATAAAFVQKLIGLLKPAAR